MSKNIVLCLSKGEFCNLELNDYVELMKDGCSDRCLSYGEQEIKSWKANFKAIKSLLCKSHLQDDIVVGFEYLIPVGGRIDCVLFGKGADGRKNMVHIELKQWSNGNVTEAYNGYTFCTDVIVEGSNQPRYCSHPSAQAHEYQNHLLNYLTAFEKENIGLYGFAYCYNYENDGTNTLLCSETYNHVTSKCPLYCKNEAESFAAKLKELVGYGEGNSIMNAIANSTVAPTKRLQDAAKNMFDEKSISEEFALIGSQLDTYNTILGAIKDKDKDNKKTVVIVKGGPGTGKSVIAMRLVADLAKTGQFENIIYSTRSTSLINGYSEILKNISYRSGNNCAVDLLCKNSKIKPYKGENWIDALIVDEAHRIEKSSNDMNDRNKREQTHLSQIMNFLFSSRVSVFFIDDFQSVKNTEIGTAEAIKKAAQNYYNNILSENEKYVNGKSKRGGGFSEGYPRLEEAIKCAKIKLDEVLQNDDEKSISKAKNKLRSLEGELEFGLEWVKDATPKIKDVEVLEFELTDQFRCNGSNNYIDWLERVLYNTDRTKNVKFDSSNYEFGVFDTATDLYKKVRSLDEFAVFADEKEKSGMAYREILNVAKSKEFNQKARLLAGWCWQWKQKTLEENGDLLHEIVIDEGNGNTFSIPWETLDGGRKPKCDEFKQRYAKNADLWLNDINGINQTGCIHSAQGWEVDYVGVIIAGDIAYDAQHDCLCINEKVKNQDSKVPKTGEDRDRITRNIYRVLMTRGKKGCFVYACDPEVREYLKRCMAD